MRAPNDSGLEPPRDPLATLAPVAPRPEASPDRPTSALSPLTGAAETVRPVSPWLRALFRALAAWPV
jgi:hypothetical protein